MLSLTNLPEEIIIIIIKNLDLKSAHNLYQTCQTMKNILAMKGVIKVCNLTHNTLATVKSLQLGLVKDISVHLHELNMCGVCDLTKSLLLPAVKRMKCLETLNVAYTNINLSDLLDLQKNCPTIKNVAINFVFKGNETLKQLNYNETMHACKEVLKKFVNVHFVQIKSLSHNLPLLPVVLEGSSLDTLTYTVCNWTEWKGSLFIYEGVHTVLPFKHFCIFMLNSELVNFDMRERSWNELLPLVKLENIEFIIIEYYNEYSVCTSPQFEKFFSDNFKAISYLSLDLHQRMEGNVAIFIWNKETTIFDDLFYCNLKKRIKGIMTCKLPNAEEPVQLGADTHLYEWYHVYPVQAVDVASSETMDQFKKKRRISPPSQILDFDSVLSEQKSVKLSMCFKWPCIVTLSPSSVYLRKLKYLSLTGCLIRYSNEFFNVLFRCCESLETLNVEAPPQSPCSGPIMRSIPLSQSLRNIRLVDKRIDFKMLFSSFSQCNILENICILDCSIEYNDLADPTTLYRKCNDLYSLYIFATVKLSVQKNLRTKINNLIKSNTSNHHMNLTLINRHDNISFASFNPYMDIFNLNPIKPV